ncbi:MAG: 30S ribosomal protein S13 [Candidatus Aenigmatarchaeota archaeon]
MVEKIKQIVRFAETNLDGSKPVKVAIRNVKGISFAYANAIMSIWSQPDKKVGELTEQEVSQLEDIINHPAKHNIPSWLYNRQKDPSTGDNKHIIVSQLDFTQRMDINEMKRLKTYKGTRHSAGLPVRGQRTRSSFRKGKTVGVSKKKAKK